MTIEFPDKCFKSSDQSVNGNPKLDCLRLLDVARRFTTQNPFPFPTTPVTPFPKRLPTLIINKPLLKQTKLSLSTTSPILYPFPRTKNLLLLSHHIQ